MDGLTRLHDAPSLAERSYQQLRDAIVGGELLPGTRLSVPDVAQRLGVSRSPIREAILRLEREGLVASAPNRGAVVASPRREDLQHLYELREVLEGLAARLAAVHATDEELAELRELWERHAAVVERGDVNEHMVVDQAFHLRTRQVARNPWLEDVLDRVSAQLRVALYATATQPGNPPLALKEHDGILKALLERDPDLAERRAREHVIRVKRALPSRLEEAIVKGG